MVIIPIEVTTSRGPETFKVYGQSADVVVRCTQFQEWLAAFDKENMKIAAIIIQSADIFDSGRVIFVKMLVEAYDRATEKPLPGITYLRGFSVCDLHFVRQREDGKIFVLIVRQPRVPVGRYAFAEIPAGTMDHEGEGLHSRMLAELAEEAGIPQAKLLGASLRKLGTFVPSTGGCDEHIACFSGMTDLSTEEIRRITELTHGVVAEGEKINASLVAIEEFVRMIADGEITDSKAITSAMLAILQVSPTVVANLLIAFARGLAEEIRE